MTITTNDVGRVELGENVYQSCILQFPQADTYAVGTILARKDVSSTIADTIVQQGSGNYTAVASSLARRTLKVGNYVATAGTLTAGVGRWTMVDPDGDIEIYTTLAAAEDMSFAALGIKLTITAVSNAFETGTTITCVVAADGDVVIYDPDGNGGAQTPVGVLPDAVTTTGSADVAASMIIGGKVNKNRLVIDDTTTVTDIHVNMLKASGIYALDQDNLSMLDNGAS